MLHSHSNADTSFERLEFITHRKSGLIYAIDDGRILKEYYESIEGDIERRAYDRLGSHPNVARYLGSTENRSLILERGQVLRKICQTLSRTDQIPLHRKLRWIRHAAEGLRHAHNNGIIHADVGCNNMVLMEDDCLKIIDFEGCSIDGGPAGSLYEWFSHRQLTPTVSRQTDIFAYGCAIYEIITGRTPYHELEEFSGRRDRVEQLHEQNQFLDVSHLPLGKLMQSCWQADFDSMNEVIQELETFSSLDVKRSFKALLLELTRATVAWWNGPKMAESNRSEERVSRSTA